MEITQFTYFQQMAGIECKPISVEITYGLERICMLNQNKKNVFDLNWNNDGVFYRDVFHQAEKEFSAYNFEHANTDLLFKIFEMVEVECKSLLEKKLSLPAYDQCLKASHVFNLLDSRGAIGVAQRAGYISRIRDLVKQAKTEIENAKVSIRNIRHTANDEMKKITNIGNNGKINKMFSWANTILFKLSDPKKIRNLIFITPIEPS